MNPVFFEAIVLCPIVLGGCFVAWRLGLRRWAIIALGPPLGLALYLALGFVAVVTAAVTTVSISVMGMVALTLAAPLLSAAPKFIHQKALSETVWIVAPAAALLAISIWAYPAADRLTDLNHGDTVQHLNIAALIHSGALAEFSSPFFLPKRQLAVGLLHAPASAAGEYYLRLMQPFIALSVLIAMAWLIGRKFAGTIPRLHLILLILAMVLALATIPRFITHAFYINGHLLAGLFLLLIAGAGWLAENERKLPEPALFALQALSTFVLIILRPEGGILAGLALAPTLLSSAVSTRIRIALCLSLGIAMVSWNGFVLAVIIAQGAPAPFASMALLALGVVVIVATPLLNLKELVRRRSLLITFTEAGLWFALIAMATRNPSLLLESIEATLINIDRFWGGYPLIVLCIAVAAVAAAKSPGGPNLRLPVTAYVPLVFLLAYLRDSAYRYSGADSLNRMIITILPLAVLFVASVAGAERLRPPIREWLSKPLPAKKPERAVASPLPPAPPI